MTPLTSVIHGFFDFFKDEEGAVICSPHLVTEEYRHLQRTGMVCSFRLEDITHVFGHKLYQLNLLPIYRVVMINADGEVRVVDI